MKSTITILLYLLSARILSAQGGYSFSTESLPVSQITSETTALHYQTASSDVGTVGMGEAKTAGWGQMLEMLDNPALLAKKKNYIDVFGFNMAMPPSTWDAAWFLEDHYNEFIEAASLTEVWDGVNAFLEPQATTQQRLSALQQVQDGMIFAVDLMNEVTGPSEDPMHHGFSVLPGFDAQFGNLGFSLYGYGQANLMVRQSPTLDALVAVDIPENLDHPLQAAKSMLQIMGILGAGILQDNRTFSQEVFPVAFYLSCIDVVGTAGYGRSVWKYLDAGANLKVINRRFSLNRIPVVEYDALIDKAFSDLNKSVTGVTLDLGFHSRLPFGTEVGLSLLNIIPMKSLEDNIQVDAIQHEIAYDLLAGKKQVNEDGDTLMVRYKRPVNLTLPFDLKVPFLVNIGFRHDITKQLSVGFDWLDIFEENSRYQSTAGRLRVGTQYIQPVWQDKLSITGRVGVGDEHVCGGIGFSIFQTVLIDGAYAWDPVIQNHAFYAQLRVKI